MAHQLTSLVLYYYKWPNCNTFKKKKDQIDTNENLWVQLRFSNKR